jgi:PAS domain S-box-containing protein
MANKKLTYKELTEKINQLEQENKEEQLRQSEEKFRALFETAKDGIFQITADGDIVAINPSFAQMHGYTVDELMKMNLKDLDTPETSYYAPERMKKLLAGEPLTFEVEHYCKNGKTIPIEVSTNLVKIGDKQYVLGFHRDITDRKQAEKERIKLENELKNTKILLQAAFEQSPIPMALATLPDYSFKIINKAAEDFLLIKTSDFLNKKLSEVNITWKDLKPNGIPYTLNELPMMRALSGMVTQNMEILVEREDGTKRWELINGAPIYDTNEKLVAGMIVFQDITERKQADEKLRESEEKFSTLFSSMTEMVALHEVVFNDKGEAINYRITDCNNVYTQITGIKKEYAVGKLATEVYQSETPPYLKEFSQVGITGEPYEYTTYYQPMDKHFIISVVSPQKNKFATITTDISAIKQIEEVISAKNKELENYLYVASHDLRSPLVNIQGFSQRLQKQAASFKTILADCKLNSETQLKINKITNEDIPKTLNYIFSSVAKMDILINGLLQISRTGRIKMTIRKINMNLLFKTIIAAFNFQLTELSAKMIVKDLPDCYGDESQINQLFSNILGNAIKYGDKNKQLIIEISARSQYNKVVYSIKDTGIGIAPRHLNKIWDVFYRVDSGSPEAGEGIGLSLAKRITDKHKGKIWAESEEGKGSIFYIELQTKEFSE